MRLFILILSFSIVYLTINSCSLLKKNEKKVAGIRTRTTDNNSNNSSEPNTTIEENDTTIILEPLDDPIVMPYEEVSEPNLDLNVTYSSDNPSNNPSNIINRTANNNRVEIFTDENITQNHPTGQLSYIVPDTMIIAEFYTISLLITKDTSLSQTNYMIEKLDNIAITDNNSKKITSTISLSKIRVSSIMSAKLIDIEDKFNIIEISTQTQNIDDSGQTQWIWKVSPKESGSKTIKLVVSVKIKNELGISQKDIPVLKKNIHVETNFKWSVKNFFISYWQWIISTLILPLLIYIWSRRKNKKNEENKNESL